MFFDANYLWLVGLPLLLGLWAQWRVSSVYKRWSRVGSRSGMTGAQVAAAILRAAGIANVAIVEIPGHLTDHYDAVKKRLSLSAENYRGTSLAALGVAAHECGHALQDLVAYPALRLRMRLVPVTNFASYLLPAVMIGGLFLDMFRASILLCVGLYLVLTVFQVVTLPVEFDASRRALRQLEGLGLLDRSEMVGARATLSAAAWTYVAALVVVLGRLLYYLSLASGNRGRR